MEWNGSLWYIVQRGPLPSGKTHSIITQRPRLNIIHNKLRHIIAFLFSEASKHTTRHILSYTARRIKPLSFSCHFIGLISFSQLISDAFNLLKSWYSRQIEDKFGLIYSLPSLTSPRLPRSVLTSHDVKNWRGFPGSIIYSIKREKYNT